MALIVEIGDGLTNADAFVSVAALKVYCDKRGHSYGLDDALIEQAIVRATSFLSDSFSWDGARVKGRSADGGAQALAWPRYNVIDEDGFTVPYTSVPIEIINATIEVARREMDEPGVMTPDYVGSERVKREKFGKVEFEYELGASGADSIRPVLLVVRDMIGPFLAKGGGSSISGLAVRA